ncbi:uncharacterized protein LOC119725047 [Patiria miniata]|uniref:HYR domain-containing protein n=1 Tax=Patiria miniata TaxID=46514 RepID=A0A913ZMM2_PATMI|nr:uncharacterized protein LOC119725047 [Patiria miniata]
MATGEGRKDICHFSAFLTLMVALLWLNCGEALVFDNSTCPPPEATYGDPPDTIQITLAPESSTAIVSWTNPVLVSPPASTLAFIFCDPDPNMDPDVFCSSGNEFPVTVNNEHGGRVEVIYQLSDTSDLFDQADCTFYISILDGTDPTITCPASFTANTDLDTATFEYYLPTPDISDNSEGVVFTTDFISGTALNVGSHVVTFTATDTSGNTANCSFTVNVEDNQIPYLECLPTLEINTEIDLPHGIATWMIPAPIDNSGGVINQDENLVSPANLPIGRHVVTYNATDESGNTAECTFDIIVTDNQPPKIECQQLNYTTEAGQPYASVTLPLEPPMVSDNSGHYTVLAVITYPDGSEIVYDTALSQPFRYDESYSMQYSVVDGSGQMVACAVSIVVEDDEAPVIMCPPDDSRSTDVGMPHSSDAPGLPTVSDNSGEDIAFTVDDTGPYEIGASPVTFSVEDSNGNSASCLVTITVIDDERPTNLTCGDGFVSTDPGSVIATAAYTLPTADDNSGLAVTVQCIPVLGAPLTLGSHMVTCVFRDQAEPVNVNYCTITLEVIDLEDPVISCPPNVSVPTDSGQAFASLTLPTGYTATDNLGISHVNVVGVNGEGPFAPGDSYNFLLSASPYSWYYIATDTAGNNNSCFWTVNVYDDEPPVVGSCDFFTGSPFSTDSNQRYSTVDIDSPSVSDNSGFYETRVFLYSPADRSAELIGPLAYNISELPISIELDYNLTFSYYLSMCFNDAAGNAVCPQCADYFHVIDDESPTVLCPDDVQGVTDPGVHDVQLSFSQASYSDNSDDSLAFQQLGGESGDRYPYGTHTITFTVTDLSNNVGSCDMTITVDDDQNPTIVCPANVNVNTDVAESYASVSLQNFMSMSDNVGITDTWVDALASMHEVGDTLSFGYSAMPYQVTYQARDDAGNAANCLITVTVGDNEMPTITCPANGLINLNTDDGQSYATSTVPSEDMQNDNVGVASVVITVNDQNGEVLSAGAERTFPFGTNSLYYKITDVADNENSCTLTIEVEDHEMPTITCPSDGLINANTDSGQAYANITLPNEDVKNDNVAVASVVITTVDPNGASRRRRLLFVGDMFNPGDQMTFLYGTNYVYYIITDTSGNENSCTLTIEVGDDQDPMIVCPANVNVNTDVAESYASVSLQNFMSMSDNVGITDTWVDALASMHEVGDTLSFGYSAMPYPVTYQAQDDAGNTVSCSITVTVWDNEMPTITCPANGLINLNTDDGQSYATSTVFSQDMHYDNVQVASVVITVNDQNGEVLSAGADRTFQFGTNSLYYKITDVAGNENNCTLTIEVEDDEMPTITCPSDGLINANTDSGQAYANITLPNEDVENDNVAVASVVITTVDPNGASRRRRLLFGGDMFHPGDQRTFPYGTNYVYYIITDTSGNENSCTLTIEVGDDQNPTIVCPANVNVNTDVAESYASVSLQNFMSMSDNVGITDTWINAGGSVHDVGDTVSFDYSTMPYQVTYQARDHAGNAANCLITVTVGDNEMPTITCPANGLINLNTDDGQSYATSTVPSEAMQHDNVQVTSVVITVNDQNGEVLSAGATRTFQFGTNSLYYKITDSAGNENSCTLTIEVEDDEMPTITCPSDGLINANTDSGQAYATITLPNEDFENDNVAVASVVITTVDPNVAMRRRRLLNDGDMFNPGDESTFPYGTNYVYYIITDTSGNENSCTLTIEVGDNEMPTITCPSNGLINLNTDDGQSYATSTVFSQDMHYDNVQVASVVITVNDQNGEVLSAGADRTFQFGTNSLYYKITDSAGNENNCTLTIEVEDHEMPTITCPSDGLINANTDSGQAYANITLPNEDVKNDNVAVASVVITTVDPNGASRRRRLLFVGDMFNPGDQMTFLYGTNYVYYIITDTSGNENSCTLTIEVGDDQDPMIVCPANVNVNTDVAESYASVSLQNFMSMSDNVGITDTWINAGGSVHDVGDTVSFDYSTTPYQVTYQAQDDAGNTVSCSITVTVWDNEMPTITCPSNGLINLNTDDGQSYATSTVFSQDMHYDNVQVASVVITVNDQNGEVLSAGADRTFQFGTNSLYYKITDSAGNENNCTLTIEVEDNEMPTITCPANGLINLNTDDGQSYATSTVPSEALQNDNVEVLSVVITVNDQNGEVLSPGANRTFQFGTNNLYYKITDVAGNENNCTLTIEVEDDEMPTITCPSDGLINANTDSGQAYANITLPNEDVENDNVAVASVVITTVDPNGASRRRRLLFGGDMFHPGDQMTFPYGTNYVYYIITDTSDNENSCTLTIEVGDNEMPTITCPANGLINLNTDDGQSYATSTVPSEDMQNDNVEVLSVNITVNDQNGEVLSAGANRTFQFGTNSLYYKITDVAGNENFCTLTIEVEDMEPPAVSCSSSFSVETQEGSNQVLVPLPEFLDRSDNVGLGPSFVRSSLHVGRFEVGDNVSFWYQNSVPVVLTYYAFDTRENYASCDLNVTVTDPEPPVNVTCPADVVTDTVDGESYGLVSLLAASATDNTGVVSFWVTFGSITLPSGTMSPTRFEHTPSTPHVVVYHVADFDGNEAVCNATVTVNDDEPPKIACPTGVLLDIPDGVVTVAVSLPVPDVTDNVPGEILIETTPANNSQFPAVESTIVTYIATDRAGNVASCNITVFIEDNIPPVLTCPDNMTLPTLFNRSYGPVSWPNPTATDNIPDQPIAITSDIQQGALFPLGPVTIELIGTDSAGNNGSCHFTITIIDIENPVIYGCPGNLNYSTDLGEPFGRASYEEPTAVDNSGSVEVIGLQRSNIFEIGPTEVVYVAVDKALNLAECRFTVTVYDMESPDVQNCPSDFEVFIIQLSMASTVTVGWQEPDFTDNSGIEVAVSSTPISNNQMQSVGTYPVTITGADPSGNTAVCTFIVEVRAYDMTPPHFDNDCPARFSFDNDPGSDSWFSEDHLVVAIDDNSGLATVVYTNELSSYPIGLTEVSVYAEDSAGNNATCSYIIEVVDVDPPNITNGCPGDIIINTALGVAVGYPTWTTPEATDNSGEVTLTSDHQSGDSFDIRDTLVTYTAIDAHNLTDTCTFVVTVIDIENPMIQSAPTDITEPTDPGLANAVVTWPLPSVTDNDQLVVTDTRSHDPGDVFPLGQTVVTYNFTDSSGNLVSHQFVVTVEDRQPPNFNDTCPTSAVEQFTPLGTATAVVQWAVPVAVDNVQVVNTTSNQVPMDVFPIGPTEVTYEAEDAAGNTGTCSFTVIVYDTEDPVFPICPMSILQATDEGSPFATVSWTVPNVTDNSGQTPTVEASDMPGDTFEIGSHTVTYLAEDNEGNTGLCSFVITVFDDEDPIFMWFPDDIMVNVPDDSGEVVVNWQLPNATDNAEPPSFDVTDYVPGHSFAIGDHDIVYTARDAAGNLVTRTLRISVSDIHLPVFDTCPPDVPSFISTDDSEAFATVTWRLPNATDNSGSAEVTSVPSPDGTFEIGFVNVTLTATDPSGNEAVCVFSFTVEDDEDPVFLSSPDNISISTDPGSAMGTATWDVPMVSDNSGDVTVTSTHQPGEQFNLGATTVIYTVNDTAGNEATVQFVVFVSDNEDPHFNQVPATIRVPTESGEPTASVDWPDLEPVDNVMVMAVSCDHSSGDTFDTGETLVTCNVTDSAGNTATATFTVIVGDSENPSIQCPESMIVDTDLGLPTAQVSFATTSSDNSGEVSVTCNPSSGSDIAVPGESVTCVATDPYSNSASCVFFILVLDEEPPVLFDCPSDIEVNEPPEDFINGSIGVTWAEPNMTDNVGVVDSRVTHLPGSVFTYGSQLVIYTAIDARGNTATCQFTINVIDMSPPVLTGCPEDLPPFPTDPGLDTSTAVSWQPPVVTDNAGVITVTLTHQPGSVFNLGDTNVSYVAVDSSGNMASCSFVVTVYDNEAPTFDGCPIQGIQNTTLPGSDLGQAFWDIPVHGDNVGVVTVTSTSDPGATFSLGASVVTYEATDAVGLTGTCTFPVSIQDRESPVLSCPSDIYHHTDVSAAGAFVTIPSVPATDNVDVITDVRCQAGSFFPIGPTEVSCFANDNSGNVGSCTFRVIVTADEEDPVIDSCPSDIIQFVSDGQTQLQVSWTTPNASDNSGNLTLSSSIDPGSRFSIGDTPVTYTAVDPFGNTAVCTFTVSVRDPTDTIPPTISCPSGILTSTDQGLVTAAATWQSPTASDDQGTPTVTSSPAMGFNFPIGTTVVVYTASDQGGNQATCSFNVSVVDNEAPVITNCPPGATYPVATASALALVSWNLPTATDNVAVESLSSNMENATSLGVGAYSVVYTAQDAAGLTDTCTFAIVVTADQCDVNDTQACPGDLTCIFITGIFKCECPFGFYRAPGTTTCLGSIEIRTTIIIVEFVYPNLVLPATFNDALLDPTTDEYHVMQADLERILTVIFSRLHRFFRIRVFNFFSGSIGFTMLGTFDNITNTSIEMFEQTLNDSITVGDLLAGSIYKVTPSSIKAHEIVCDEGYCLNGATCQASQMNYQSTCRCLEGYTGDRCEQQTLPTTDEPKMTTSEPTQGLSTLAIVLIAVSAMLVMFIVMMCLLCCCCLSAASSRRQKIRMYEAEHEYPTWPGYLYRANVLPRALGEGRYLSPNSRHPGFTRPYVATGDEEQMAHDLRMEYNMY